jgi:hypothetical protein
MPGHAEAENKPAVVESARKFALIRVFPDSDALP